MARETINPLDAAVQVLEDYYTRIVNPEAHAFSLPIVRLAVALTTNDFVRIQYPRTVVLMACIYQRMTNEERLALADANLPVEAREDGDLVAWPDPLPPVEFSAPGAEVLDSYRQRMIVALRMGIDREASKVIVGGDRMVMTQLSQVMEARAVLAQLYAGSEPSNAEFPHLAAYKQISGLPDLVVTAQTIMAMATAWGAANASLEVLRVNSSQAITMAETVEDIDGIFASAIEQASAVVAMVLAAIA